MVKCPFLSFLSAPTLPATFRRPCLSPTSDIITLMFHTPAVILTSLVNRSTHAIRILSAVAGLSNRNLPVSPESARADFTASLMAKNAEAPRNKGGSPIPCNERRVSLILEKKVDLLFFPTWRWLLIGLDYCYFFLFYFSASLPGGGGNTYSL